MIREWHMHQLQWRMKRAICNYCYYCLLSLLGSTQGSAGFFQYLLYTSSYDKSNPTCVKTKEQDSGYNYKSLRRCKNTWQPQLNLSATFQIHSCPPLYSQRFEIQWISHMSWWSTIGCERFGNRRQSLENSQDLFAIWIGGMGCLFCLTGLLP